MGKARLDQINHKMHYVITGERNTRYQAWVKEREVEGAKATIKKRKSSGFGNSMKSKAAKRTERESREAEKAAGEAKIAMNENL